jgi:3-methyladenine DNA glycosylase AlkD
MTVNEILVELEAMGNPSTKNTFLKHGASEPIFGVKVQDLKKIIKKTKKNHALSLALFETGNSDAMYLAGLMADEKQISKETLDTWAARANWSMISEYTVAWVAAETPHGFELGMKWMESDKENIASAGWSTLASYAMVTADENLDIATYSELLDRVEKEIHISKNRVSYAMNAFVIAVGCYVKSLSGKAIAIGEKIGVVTVNMNGTACKVPLATAYIQKVVDKNGVGKKKKMARC